MTDKSPSNEVKQGGDLQDTSVTSRRAVLTTGGLLGAALIAETANAQEMDHSQHAAHTAKHSSALNAANECIVETRNCMVHTLSSFQAGNTALGDCARKINEMLPICDALAAQLSTNSVYLRDVAAVCQKACNDCETECRKHETMHIECKRCADSCAKLIDAIDRL